MKKMDSGTVVAIAMMFLVIGMTMSNSNRMLGFAFTIISGVILLSFLIGTIKSRINKKE